MNSLSVVLFGDMQEQNDIARRVIQVAAAIQPDLCIVLGDLVGSGADPAQWARCDELLAPLDSRCELVAIPGNHDYERAGVAENFARRFRAGAPPYVAMSRSGCRFILLDTMLNDSTMERGLFLVNSPQSTWLETELADARQRGEPAFVCGHHPIFMSPELYFSTSPTIRVDDEGGAIEPSPLLSTLLRGRAQMYFSGHIHLYDRSRFEGLPCITSGASSYDFPAVEDPANRFSELCVNRYHLCHLEIGENVVKFKAIDQNAEPFDEWEEGLRRGEGSQL